MSDNNLPKNYSKARSDYQELADLYEMLSKMIPVPIDIIEIGDRMDLAKRDFDRIAMIYDEAPKRCPYCGVDLIADENDLRCPECGLAWSVELEIPF